MRILHLISNFKFTGPVDPALLLAQGLRESGQCEVLVGLGARPASQPDRFAGAVARSRGIPLWETPALGKHRRFFLEWFDVRAIRRQVSLYAPDIVHTHIGNDYRLAVKAGAPRIVHSVYEGSWEDVPEPRRAHVLAHSAGLIVHSSALAGQAPVARARVQFVPPPLDLARFDPARELRPAADLRLPPHRLVIGVVARLQRHRSFDVLLEAFRLAVLKDPSLLLVMVGRGTRAREVAAEPVRRMGLERSVYFPGYVAGDDYVALLRRFGMACFLVPGTDGTCRALREAMAMGIAILGTRRGMIPELLGNGANGVLVEESPAQLSEAMLRLAGDDALRAQLGQEARRRAQTFDHRACAAEVLRFYREILG